MPHERRYILLFGLFILSVATLGVVSARKAPVVYQYPGTSPTSPARPVPKASIPPEKLDEKSCVASGGSWNSCASACPDVGAETTCIQVCIERCEYPDGTVVDAKR